MRIPLCRVIVSTHALAPKRRTWRERLFGWPWRPWKSTQPVPAMFTAIPGDVLDAEFLQDTVIVHPALLEVFQHRLLQEGLYLEGGCCYSLL